ncbi:hypothetical protein J6590_079312 [Homalodisca vitripennis]|nr:hypothetical protein J6590_079312 [Homalodisca vitripennis]
MLIPKCWYSPAEIRKGRGPENGEGCSKHKPYGEDWTLIKHSQAKPKQPGGGGCKSRLAHRITLFAPTAHSLSQYPLCVECDYECVLVVIWLFLVLYTVLWSVSCGSISVSELREWYK